MRWFLGGLLAALLLLGSVTAQQALVMLGSRDASATETVSTLTRSGTTATATTATVHNYVSGDLVTVAGADQTEYNIAARVTVSTSTVFTYTVSGTPATPATGTITAIGPGIVPTPIEVNSSGYVEVLDP